MDTKCSRYEGLIKRYFKYLPVDDKTPIITINEGNTPLIKADNLAKAIGIKANLYLKYDGVNPTGSFKDRGMTLAVTKAVEAGSKAIICASTGNTSASAAAYAAKAGIKAYMLVPAGYVAVGKLAQAMLYGAEAVAIDGNFDDALEIVIKLSENYPITLVNSVNPFRIEGQKTAAFEVCDVLGKAPDYLCIPVGNAGNITAYWKGFKEYFDNKIVPNKPHMMGFEAEGSAAIVRGERIHAPETIATAIRIGNPASWDKAVNAVNESSGAIDSVTDEEIINAYKLVARTEGVFAEPASAASIAGLIKANSQNKIKENSTIVCVLTGNGLKDPDSAMKYANSHIKNSSSSLNDIVKLLNL